MRLGGGRPRKKRRNAKARYDKEYPVVPIRLHRKTKKQLVKEAKKKGLMLSQYIRDLLQGMEIRERVVERTVEKPVTKTVVKTVESPEKVVEIEELRRALKSMRERASSQQAKLEESLSKRSEQQMEISRLEESLSSLSEEYRKLEEQRRAKVGEIQVKEKDMENLRSSMTAELSTLSERRHHAEEQMERLLSENSELLTLNSKLERQLEWALNELKTNDSRNEAIAQKIADAYGKRIFFVSTSWEEMPEE